MHGRTASGLSRIEDQLSVPRESHRSSKESLIGTLIRFCDVAIRTIAAVILCFLSLYFTRSLGALGILIAVTVGAPLSILAFIARKRDVLVIARSYAFALAGAVVGSMFGPSVNADPEDGFLALTTGAIVGWLLAAIRNQTLLARDGTSEQTAGASLGDTAQIDHV